MWGKWGQVGGNFQPEKKVNGIMGGAKIVNFVSIQVPASYGSKREHALSWRVTILLMNRLVSLLGRCWRMEETKAGQRGSQRKIRLGPSRKKRFKIFDQNAGGTRFQGPRPKNQN